MIEIGLNKVNKHFGFNKLLTDVSFEIKTNEEYEKVVTGISGLTYEEGEE